MYPVPYGQPQPFAPQQPPRTNGLAIASLVCGIVAWVLFPLVAAIPAVICGHVALRQTRRHAEAGGGLAIAGLVLGWINVAVFGLVLCFFGVAILGCLGAAGGIAPFIDPTPFPTEPFPTPTDPFGTPSDPFPSPTGLFPTPTGLFPTPTSLPTS